MILDVVYNHLGPDGNYLTQFSAEYFTDRYENEWGKAINFDGPGSGPVREFVAANAAYWAEEYHLDGLRLDATQQIFDASPVNIMACSRIACARRRGERKVIVVAENEPQHTVLVRPRDRGGYGLDALWNDDFHHTARVAVTGQQRGLLQRLSGTAPGADIGGQVRLPLPGTAQLLADQAARHAGARTCARRSS